MFDSNPLKLHGARMYGHLASKMNTNHSIWFKIGILIGCEKYNGYWLIIFNS